MPRITKYTPIILLGLVILSNCNSSNRLYDGSNCGLKLRKGQECYTLSLLSDTLYWNERNPEIKCFQPVVKTFFERAGLRSYRGCYFEGCFYPSYSLEKSVFKIDLLRLMRYYGCADSIRLKSYTRGIFSKYDTLHMREIKILSKIIVDTSIMYQE